MEEHLSCKWMSKESWNSNTYIGQNRLFFFLKDFIYLFDRDRDSQRETQAGRMGEEEAGS